MKTINLFGTEFVFNQPYLLNFPKKIVLRESINSTHVLEGIYYRLKDHDVYQNFPISLFKLSEEVLSTYQIYPKGTKLFDLRAEKHPLLSERIREAFKEEGIVIKDYYNLLQLVDWCKALESRYCLNDGDYWIDLDNRFFWRDGDFGDDDSCYFTTRRYNLSALKSLGAFAFRLWSYNQRTNTFLGKGRLWAVPFKEESLITFNPYGMNCEYWPWRVLISKLLRVPSRPIQLFNNGKRTGDFYINTNPNYIFTRNQKAPNEYDFGISTINYYNYPRLDEGHDDAPKSFIAHD